MFLGVNKREGGGALHLKTVHDWSRYAMNETCHREMISSSNRIR